MPAAERQTDPAERWVAAHARPLLVVYIFGVAAWWTYLAGLTYLNADEADHLSVAALSSWGDVLAASRNFAHPPLYFFVLHAWRMAFHSERALRLSSVLAGSAALWFCFRWIRAWAGLREAIIGAALLAFAVPTVEASIELRQYAWLLLFLTAALDSGERALDGDRRWLAFHVCAASLALLTHYSALWGIAACESYYALRLVREHRRRQALAWLTGAAILAAVWLALYLCRVRGLRGSEMERAAVDIWLRYAYYHPGGPSVLGFAARQTHSIFAYFTGSPWTGVLSFAAFALALVGLARSGDPDGRAAAWLLGAPWAFLLLASLLRWYPLDGSSHSIVLLPFCVAAGAWLIARAPVGTATLGPIVFAGAAGWFAAVGVRTLENPLDRQRRDSMTAAIGQLRLAIPPGTPIFTDERSLGQLEYYLTDDRTRGSWRWPPREPVVEDSLGGYRIVYAPANGYMFRSDQLDEQLHRMIGRFGSLPDDSVWIFEGGPASLPPSSILRAPTERLSRQWWRYGNILLARVRLGDRPAR